jgi:hypothetical protein
MGDQFTATLHKSSAIQYYRTYKPEDIRKDEELREVDFDDLIGFQSR